MCIRDSGNSCLEKSEDKLPVERRQIVETMYQRGAALIYHEQFDEAVKYFNDSITATHVDSESDTVKREEDQVTNAHGVHKLKFLNDSITVIGCNGGYFNYEAQDEWLDISFSFPTMLQPGITGCREENTARAEHKDGKASGTVTVGQVETSIPKPGLRDATRTGFDSMYCFEDFFTKCTVL